MSRVARHFKLPSSLLCFIVQYVYLSFSTLAGTSQRLGHAPYCKELVSEA
jgi:hypothetical protein